MAWISQGETAWSISQASTMSERSVKKKQAVQEAWFRSYSECVWATMSHGAVRTHNLSCINMAV